MRIPRLPAAALLLLLLVVAGAAAQEEAGDARPEEIAAEARAKEEVAALAAELGQLRAKVSALGACARLTLHASARFCSGGWRGWTGVCCCLCFVRVCWVRWGFARVLDAV
jgi:hypothetical protein